MSAGSPGSSRPVGSIDGKPVTEEDLVAGNTAQFEDLKQGYETKQRQLELEYAKARHDLMQRELDKRLDRAALEAEARSRGIAPDGVLAEVKVEAPTEQEQRAFYEENKDRIRAPYEVVAPQVLEHLTSQRRRAAERKFYDGLRAKYAIRSSLGPYRVAVAATGPARGKSAAPVTIVEFADFECPFCKASEGSLRTLASRYPNDVRLVFRNMPLTKIHPQAWLAAEAGVCADRQGKFWEMHDAMYDDQQSLALDGLKSTAARLGMDPGRFAGCLQDASTARPLESDMKAGRELGIEGTPYFFINGRPVDGDVPLETFQNMVEDELQRNGRAGS